MMNPLGLVSMAIGAFVLAAVVTDWNWFLINRKARPIVSIPGRNAARMFYVFGGVFLVGGIIALFMPT